MGPPGATESGLLLVFQSQISSDDLGWFLSLSGPQFPHRPRRMVLGWLGQELLSWHRLFVGRESLTHPRVQMGLKESSKGKTVVRKKQNKKVTELTTQPAI